MSAEAAADLRAWLKEPAFSQEQRLPLQLDAKQGELATTRTETGYRRIKGPAGSGKSVVLAARAAELADEGKRVLVVTFNITFLNYLRDLAARHVSSRRVMQRQIDFLNFHRWCKRVCEDSGRMSDYRRLPWREGLSQADPTQGEVLGDGLAQLVAEIYDSPRLAADLPRYDAVLVDEGQDYRPSWWNTLRKAVRPGGEMLLVADKTQNIYGTAAAWTDEVMSGAGFRGDWSTLSVNYRLPPAVVPLLETFAESFLRSEEVDLPRVQMVGTQMELADLYPVDLRWVHVHSANRSVQVCVDEIRHQMRRLRDDTAIPDITFLAGLAAGRLVVASLEKMGVRVLHTFDPDGNVARRQKRAFFQGSAQVKATTLHSFKGWEARHLVLFVDSAERAEDRALLYTAMTRIRRHEKGSALTVVSPCQDLHDYGSRWPEFVSV